MQIAIASDHGGYLLKEAIKKKFFDHKLQDLGCFSEDSVDYPDYAKLLCEEILSGKADQGIIVCGTGIGISISANRYKGIRAALCLTEHMAEMARKHNDANVLALGGRILSEKRAFKIVEKFLATDSEGGRHLRRIRKIDSITE